MLNEMFFNMLKSDEYKPIVDYFLSDRPKVLFGRGRQVCVLYELFMMLGVKIDATISSTGNDYAEEKWIRNIPSFSVKDFQNKGHVDILLSVSGVIQDDIERTLLEAGYRNIYKFKQWQSFNSFFRQTYFEYMMKKNGVIRNGSYLEYGKFKILDPIVYRNFEYRNSFLPEAMDLMYPFLFDDITACIEGSYEYGKVRLNAKEIVIDAGANIGMFSCLAASRNCKVFAFEPSATINEVLMQNAALYGDSINVINAALADRSGEITFSVSDNNENNKNKITEELIDGSHIENVNCYSLDDFVDAYNITKIDFIKADIEGAERDMLRGARKVLKEHAPKLALCTYHIPDDPEVMERLILEANPNYVITHKWMKLYAYVP